MRRLALVAALALVAQPVLGPVVGSLLAQGTVMFQMNMANPNTYGFSGGNPTDGVSGQSTNNGVFYTFSHQATAGPSGGPAARITMIDINAPLGSCVSQGTCEGYVGWGYPSYSATEITQGNSIWIHLYMQVVAFSAPLRVDGGAWGGKMILVGDGCVTADRWIINLEAAGIGSSTPRWNIDKNISGVGFTNDLPTDFAWHAYVFELDTSTTSGTTDAVMRYFEDTDSGTPTQSSTSSIAWASGCLNENLKLGSYPDWLTSGTATYQFGGMKVSTARDSSWFANMTTATGAIPTPPRVRLKSAE
jgi:hypothetical protein